MSEVINQNYTYIPAKIDINTFRPLDSFVKKRVAAYARVSRDTDEQLKSYGAQIAHYVNHIKANPEYEFVEVYADEGISGTNTKNRDNFNRMMKDALDGKIDLIITKSCSRFARNTVDTLVAVRQLKEKGIEIFFEKENIYTLDTKGELLISLMSTLAQEESRSISENVKWGKRNKLALEKKINLPYKHFLGYEKGEDGKPKVIESEAVVVRRIYDMFLDGRSFNEIAVCLTDENIPTPTGRKVWNAHTIMSILQNEKYAGNALLQKAFTIDFLTKKVKVNEGEVDQWFLHESHEAIIPPLTYELVQDEIRRRKASRYRLIGWHLFCGRIICGRCGAVYGAKTWHSGTKYQKVVWQCLDKYVKKPRCTAPNISEENIQKVFIDAWSKIIASREVFIAKYEQKIASLEDISAYDKRQLELTAGCSEAKAMADNWITQNSIATDDQVSDKNEFDKLVEKYNSLKEQLNATIKEKMDCIARRERLRSFVEILQREEVAPTVFDEKLWRETLESITIHTLDNIVVCFRSEDEIKVSIDDPSA